MTEMNAKFTAAVSKAMEQKNITIRDLALAADTTYEHMRKIVRGLAFPSKHVQRTVCEQLGLDKKQMESLVTEDRIKSKYGGTALRLSGKNPEMDPIDVAWPYLSEQHKKDIINMAQMWAKTDRSGKTKSA